MNTRRSDRGAHYGEFRSTGTLMVTATALKSLDLRNDNYVTAKVISEKPSPSQPTIPTPPYLVSFRPSPIKIRIGHNPSMSRRS